MADNDNPIKFHTFEAWSGSFNTATRDVQELVDAWRRSHPEIDEIERPKIMQYTQPHPYGSSYGSACHVAITLIYRERKQ